MPTFGNILARKGGTAMTGKEVTLSLAIPSPKDGKPFVETAVVLLLPVSEARKSAAFRAADAYVAECERVAAETGQQSTAPSVKDERALRFLCESMRDASDARKFFVEATRSTTFETSSSQSKSDCFWVSTINSSSTNMPKSAQSKSFWR